MFFLTSSISIALAGGPDCEVLKNIQKSHSSHGYENLVTEASPEGATGKSYAIYYSKNESFINEFIKCQIGIFDDVYVKTSQGWRFKSRAYLLAYSGNE